MSMNINTEAQKDQAQLEREIDQQRAHIGETMSALEAQFSPGQMLDKVLSYSKTNGAELSRNLVETVRDNPVPALLTALGVAWLMYGQNNRPRYRTDAEYGYASNASYGVDPSYDHHPSKAAELKNKAMHLKDSVKGNVGEMEHRLGHAGHEVRARAARAGHDLQTLMHEQPLAIGAIGIAVGALVAASLPATSTEDRYMGDARDKVATKVRQKVQEGKQKINAMGQSMTRTEKEINENYGSADTGYTPPYSTSSPAGASLKGRSDANSPKFNS
jgi:ElaB/YqjD/DUF883 family membrane-anchored ribosome-binding protein